MRSFLLLISFIAAIGTYLSIYHIEEEKLDCGDGFTKLDPSQIPPDQFPPELKSLVEQDGFDAELCVKKVKK
jgi:hypothetical protein